MITCSNVECHYSKFLVIMVCFDALIACGGEINIYCDGQFERFYLLFSIRRSFSSIFTIMFTVVTHLFCFFLQSVWRCNELGSRKFVLLENKDMWLTNCYMETVKHNAEFFTSNKYFIWNENNRVLIVSSFSNPSHKLLYHTLFNYFSWRNEN